MYCWKVIDYTIHYRVLTLSFESIKSYSTGSFLSHSFAIIEYPFLIADFYWCRLLTQYFLKALDLKFVISVCVSRFQQTVLIAHQYFDFCWVMGAHPGHSVGKVHHHYGAVARGHSGQSQDIWSELGRGYSKPHDIMQKVIKLQRVGLGHCWGSVVCWLMDSEMCLQLRIHQWTVVLLAGHWSMGGERLCCGYTVIVTLLFFLLWQFSFLVNSFCLNPQVLLCCHFTLVQMRGEVS